MALAQLADAGGTPTAGNSGPAPAALLLPYTCTADGYPLRTGNAAGQARDASSTTAAGHRHLRWSRLLSRYLVWEEWIRKKKETLGGKVTNRLHKRNTRRIGIRGKNEY